jgi:RNA polymerase sigma-70 factor, ECF subfamily
MFEPFVYAARLARPDLPFRADAFSAFLQQTVDADRITEVLPHAGDLLLAYLAGTGDPQALRIFEKEVIPQIDRSILRAQGDGGSLEEAKQRLRIHLLIGSEATPPRILLYRGRGPLLAWTRTIAGRIAGRLRDEDDLEQTMDEASDVRSSLKRKSDPEALLTVIEENGGMRALLESSVAQLDEAERASVRLYYLEKRNLEEIATTLTISRATAGRLVTRARAKLQAALAEHAPSTAEIDGLAENLSVSRIFPSPKKPT